MARRKTSIVEDIFDMLQELPWWAGVAAAGMFWFVGLIVTGRATQAPIQTAIRPMIKLVFNGLAVISLIAAAVSAIKSGSRRKLLDRQKGIESLRALSWRQFEQLVGEAYRRRGYSVEETGGRGADGGVDLKLRGNGETILVQCKRWRTQRVGVDKVRELFGVVTAERATGGILVSSGRFTNAAKSFAAGKPLTLVDGPALSQLVREVQPGTAPAMETPDFPSPSSEPDCPRCGDPMVLRTARRGANAGSQFYGCPRYPHCRGTRPVD